MAFAPIDPRDDFRLFTLRLKIKRRFSFAAGADLPSCDQASGKPLLFRFQDQIDHDATGGATGRTGIRGNLDPGNQAAGKVPGQVVRSKLSIDHIDDLGLPQN